MVDRNDGAGAQAEREPLGERRHLFRYGAHEQHLEAPRERVKVSELKEIIARHVGAFNFEEALVLEERGDRPDEILTDETEVHIHETPHFHSEQHAHGRTIHYTVDDEPQKTTRHELTAQEILRDAGIDPSTHYLVEIEEHKRISYQQDPLKKIHMRDHMKFVSVSTGPTPVS